MRTAVVILTGWRMADALIELRIWLDHNDCEVVDFECIKLPDGNLRVQAEFVDDSKAEAFERQFGR